MRTYSSSTIKKIELGGRDAVTSPAILLAIVLFDGPQWSSVNPVLVGRKPLLPWLGLRNGTGCCGFGHCGSYRVKVFKCAGVVGRRLVSESWTE